MKSIKQYIIKWAKLDVVPTIDYENMEARLTEKLTEANRRIEYGIMDSTSDTLDQIWKSATSAEDYQRYNEAHELLYSFRRVKKPRNERCSTCAGLGFSMKGPIGHCPECYEG